MSPHAPGAGDDPRAGGLLRTVAVAFAAFALVAVTLSTALTYLSTRGTLLASQGGAARAARRLLRALVLGRGL